MSDDATPEHDNSIARAMDEGRAHHSAGRLPQAEAMYRHVLAAEPNNPDALYMLGGTALQQGKNALAAECFDKAITAQPDSADYHINLGIALNAQGKRKDAVAAFQSGAALAPDDAGAHYNLGIALQGVGRLDGAEAAYRRAVQLRLDHAGLHFNLGNVLRARGKLEDAAAALQKALTLKPDYAEAHNNLGNVLRGQGHLDGAVASLQKALALKPDDAPAHNNLAAVLLDQGKPGEALVALGKALALNPENAEAHFNLGNALRAQDKLDDAVAAYNRAIKLRPDYVKAHNNLGAALQNQGKLRAAEAAYREILTMQPDDAEAHNNLGGVLKDQGRLEEALPSFRRAIAIDPAFDQAHSNLIFCLPYDPRTTARELAAEQRAWAQQHERPILKSPEFPAADDPERRLRIGLVSPDFYAHPGGFFLEPLLSRHDRSAFEILCYANSSKNDDVTARLRGHADEWRQIAGLSDAAFAQLVRRDRIDILIELSGHQADNRLLALARRPAPIQVGWLGAVNGRGMASLDYLITDSIHAPVDDDTDALYVEQLIRLPNGYACYRPPDYAPAVREPPAIRTGHLTFGCFNNFAKINDRVIALWAKILHAVPDAHLMVKTPALKDDITRQQLVEAFAAAGISGARIDLRGPSPHAELLACYGEVDIALDPFPYSGGLTTCEALWMGVPVITWPGELAQGRHSASHLTNVGLSEFIAGSAAEYVERATRWANDIPALSALRACLRENMAISNLCDGAKFTLVFESELRRIWRQWSNAGRGERFTDGRA